MTYVKKRCGTLATWDSHKITLALEKAFAATQIQLRRVACEAIGALVITKLKDTASNDTMVDIEDIQDAVEGILMDRGYHKTAKAYILYRENKAQLRVKHPDNSAIADYIHPAKYGQYLPEKLRREVYSETVDRSMNMHIKKFPELAEEIRNAFVFVRNKQVLPSMRSMQFGGFAVEKHNARLYNCSFTLIDRTRAFAESFYLLLAGCGVGFSVQKQHIANLPEIKHCDESKVRHFVVADTIEGWADSVDALFDAMYTGYWIEFNYGLIRPEGSPLSSGGKAPGHVPLKKLHVKLGKLLSKASGRKLKDIECHDAMCLIAQAVLSGGIRRSSLISLFSPDSEDMLTCKNPENFRYSYGDDPGKNSYREMANNSAVCLRYTVTQDQFEKLFKLAVTNFGEPGFFFTNNLNYGTNPCGEIGLDPVLLASGTGFSFCNLCEVNLAACKLPSDMAQATRAASFIGTLQASYTSFPYLGSVSEQIAKRDALLGVGLTGMCDNPVMAFDGDLLAYCAEEAIKENIRVAKLISINPAVRVTTVKPSGTASLELGCVGSGIHPHHAKRYFRRVTANKLEPVAQYFKSINPHMVEEKPNGDWSIVFPIAAPEDSVTLKEQTASDFLSKVFLVYDKWVRTGSLNKYLTHNVSSTVTVRDTEWDSVMETVWKNRNSIAAMSFAPYFLDSTVPYAPRQEVVTEVDEARWRMLIDSYKKVDYTLMREDVDSTDLSGESACAGGACDISSGVFVKRGDGRVIILNEDLDSCKIYHDLVVIGSSFGINGQVYKIDQESDRIVTATGKHGFWAKRVVDEI